MAAKGHDLSESIESAGAGTHMPIENAKCGHGTLAAGLFHPQGGECRSYLRTDPCEISPSVGIPVVIGVRTARIMRINGTR